MRNSIYISNQTSREILKKYQISQASFNFNGHINELNYFSYHYGLPTTNVGNDFKAYYDAVAGIEYYGVRCFKHRGIGKALNVFLENIGLYIKILRRKEKNVWFYNVWTNTVLLYLLIRFLSTKKTFILLADYNPHRSNPLLDSFILWCHRKANAVLSLSARCRETNANFYAIPGIIPERKICKHKGELSGKHNFLLSGVISKDNGIDMVLDVFREIPDAKLTITGTCNDEIKKRSNQIKNVNCLGYIEDYDEYLEILSDSDYLLSWRDPFQPVNHYNFPSKILETLARNRTAVISTIQYEELDGVNYFYEEYNKEKLIALIKEIIEGKHDCRTLDCLNNADVLVKKYSERAWIQTFEIIEKL